jgi:hypothetical protein
LICTVLLSIAVMLSGESMPSTSAMNLPTDFMAKRRSHAQR